MGKTKNQNHSDNEYWKGLIRNLEKQLRDVKKQLKYYTKRENQFENNKEELEALAILQANETEYKATLKICKECNKGSIDAFEIMNNKWIFTCTCCGYRYSEIINAKL